MMLRSSLPALALGLAASAAALPALAEAHNLGRDITVPASVSRYIGRQLPERQGAPTAYVDAGIDSNVLLGESAKLHVTFLDEGAGYRNSFGYFIYTVGGGGAITVLHRSLLFPNASKPSEGTLVAGHTLTIDNDYNGGTYSSSAGPRSFPAGTRIGFFVVADGYNRSYTTWSAAPLAYPSTTPATNGNVAAGLFTSLPVLNPEYPSSPSYAKHVAMFRSEAFTGFIPDPNGTAETPFFVMGFEDLLRPGGDNDFNDIVFLVSSTPDTAITTGTIPVVVPTIIDGDHDGVEDEDEDFDDDADRAFNNRTPTSGYYTVAFEDNYPFVGDADYNDAVVNYATNVVTDDHNKVKELVGTYHLIARGASYDASFGVAIDGIPAGATGQVWIERFSPAGASVGGSGPVALSTKLVTLENGAKSARLTDLIANLAQNFPNPGGGYTNTLQVTPTVQPYSVRFRIVFDSAISATGLASAPFDPFLEVLHGADRYDIHLPGKAAFAGRPESLPSEARSPSFMDDNGYPWAVVVPFDWLYPLEAVNVSEAYSQFSSWRSSRGSSNLSWYTGANADLTIGSTAGLSRTRSWTVKIGGKLTN